MLYKVFLFLFGIIMFFCAVAAGGWWSTPFLIAVWVIAYLIENSVRGEQRDDWKGYLGLPGFCLLCLVLGIPSSVKQKDEDFAPIYEFDKLKVSEGILKKGASGDISLIRDHAPSLSLLCRDNAGKGSTQTCITEDFKKAYGKRVTVYHEPAFKSVTTKAYIYEVRFEGQKLVGYDKIIQSVRHRRSINSKADRDLSIMLVVSTICSLMYVALRRRETLRAS